MEYLLIRAQPAWYRRCCWCLSVGSAVSRQANIDWQCSLSNPVRAFFQCPLQESLSITEVAHDFHGSSCERFISCLERRTLCRGYFSRAQDGAFGSCKMIRTSGAFENQKALWDVSETYLKEGILKGMSYKPGTSTG